MIRRLIRGAKGSGESFARGGTPLASSRVTVSRSALFNSSHVYSLSLPEKLTALTCSLCSVGPASVELPARRSALARALDFLGSLEVLSLDYRFWYAS